MERGLIGIFEGFRRWVWGDKYLGCWRNGASLVLWYGSPCGEAFLECISHWGEGKIPGNS